MFKKIDKEFLVFIGVGVFSISILFFWFINLPEMIKIQKSNSENIALNKEGKEIKKISEDFKSTFNGFKDDLSNMISSSSFELDNSIASSSNYQEKDLNNIDLELKQKIFYLPNASSSLEIDLDNSVSSTSAQEILKQELEKIIKKI